MNEHYNVLVLDMQPIDPPVGGGRLRLLGLYHNLGKNMQATYVGTYDWPGEKYRDHALSSTLREIDIPLSDSHFEACRNLQEEVNGKTVIDVTFHQLAHLSPDYVDYVRKESMKADIVVFSHPWIYPLVKDLLRKDKQLVVYDAHNVEGLLRTTLLDDGGAGTGIVKDVVSVEYELCHAADVVLTCSHEDMTLFNKLYNVPLEKMRVVPNGVFTETIKPVNQEEKAARKKQLGLGSQSAAIFIGSNYPPNVEAVRFIIKELAPRLPGVMFVVAGGVGSGIDKKEYEHQENVRVTGFLEEDKKLLWLAASDIAVNPMFSGSGTNIKMFDFMAAGLPIVSTSYGTRGIADNDYAGILIRDKNQFLSAVLKLLDAPRTAQDLGQVNRRLTERAYSWESISPELGILLGKQASKRKKEAYPQDKKEQKRNKLAMMTTWNIRCGIAENSNYLINALEAKNVDVFIIANTNTDWLNSYPISDISRNIYKLWDYDFVQWKNSSINIEGVLHLLLNEAIPTLNIQYHPGFFNHAMLIDLVNRCTEAGVDVSITLHHAQGMLNALKELKDTKTKIVVLSAEEKKRLDAQGINNVVYIPLGVLEFPDENRDDVRTEMNITGFPVIGSFGFMRPYKGVMEAIEAIGVLRNIYPNIVFLGINALYPSEDSDTYYQQCKQRIDSLGLSNNVLFKTDFLDIRETVHYLHACDIVVLPYHDSRESASAAANIVLAAKRPLIISRSPIFAEIKNIGRYVDNIEPATLANEIQHVLSSPALLGEMKDKVMRCVAENSFGTIAGQYLETIFRKDPLAPDYEMLVQKVYESILEDGDIAVDVGAHIGRHTIPVARKIYPHGRVFAFEPLPMCRKNILDSMKEESSRISSVVSISPYALSNYDGESEFVVAMDALGYSGLKERKYDCETRIEKIKVTVKRMDNVLADIHSLKYIKIDAEGGEFDIIRGGTQIIKKFRPLVTFEFGLSSFGEYSVNPAEVFNFWYENHYRIYDILGNLLNEAKAFTNSAINQNLWDYIAIPEENTLLTSKVIKAIKSIIGSNGQ